MSIDTIFPTSRHAVHRQTDRAQVVRHVEVRPHLRGGERVVPHREPPAVSPKLHKLPVVEDDADTGVALPYFRRGHDRARSVCADIAHLAS